MAHIPVIQFVEPISVPIPDMQITVLPFMTLNDRGQKLFEQCQEMYDNGNVKQTLHNWVKYPCCSGLLDGKMTYHNYCVTSKVHTSCVIRTSTVILFGNNWIYTQNGSLYALDISKKL